jgi:thioredoxin reductase
MKIVGLIACEYIFLIQGPLLIISSFHCLFCHGYEQRGSPSAGVLAMDDCSPAPIALHLARFANRLAEKVTIYTNGNETVTEPIKQLLSGVRPESKTTKCIAVDNRKITKFVKGNKKGELTIFFENGESKLEGFLTHKPKGEVNGPWKEQLGLELTAAGDFMVNAPFGETNVKGVFAAGDSSNMMKAVALAISSGGLIAAGVATSIGVED